MRDKWGWLYDGIQALHDEGVEMMDASNLWDYLGLEQRGLNPRMIGQQLSDMGIRKHQGSNGRYNYTIDTFDLGSIRKSPVEGVLVQ
jgi:hypothetical protein